MKLLNKIQMKKEVVGLSQSSRMRNEILKIESRQNSCCIGEEERGEACLHSSPFSAAAFPSPPPLLPLFRPTRWPSCQRSVLFQPLCVSSNSLEPLLHSSPPLWLWPPLEEQLVPCSSSLYLTLLRKAALLLL